MLYICYTYYKETKKQERYLSSDDFRCFNYEEYPKNVSTRRYINNYMLAIISDDKETIEEFKQFIKTNNFSQYNISYFNKINEVNLKSFDTCLEIIKTNDNYEFKMKSQYISISTQLNDEESELISFTRSSENEMLNEYSFLIHKFLFYIKKPINPKKFGVYSCKIYPTNSIKSEAQLLILVPIFLSFVYGLIFLSFSSRMIDEKEKKLDLLLNRYGIKKYQYILSWFLTYLVLTSFTTICTIITICYILIFKKQAIIIILFIITHLLFSIGIFAMSFFLQTIISQLKTGQTMFKVLFFGINILGVAAIFFDTPKIIKVLFSLFPHIAQTENLFILLLLQFIENPNFGFYFSKYKKTSFAESLFFLIFDIFFYICSGLIILSYKESGVDFITFILSPIKGKNRLIEEKGPNKNFEFNYSHEELSKSNLLYQEQRHMLDIKNVTRKYEDLIAVDNFSGQLFPNEIFCLLGHNGAGKTTLIKMISGIEDPDEGDIFLNNVSLVTNKKYLYENIGLCNQEDIYFDYLTVEEHLRYMAEIKGGNTDMNEINDLLVNIELISKKSSLCDTLSGGQKRKLCIALSLIGNSQLILLDEPSSGLDVLAKKALWNFLKQYKKDKIIILTTHSLDEAEYLGDRIGIMSEGHFLCSGSSSYLKDKYPCGYNINLILNSKIFTKEKKQMFLNDIKNINSNFEIKISSKGLLSISYEVIDDKAKNIFDYIDSVKDDIGIEDYTIATTSLEDVFLKLNVSEKTKNISENILSEGLEIQNDPKNLHNEVSSFSTQLGHNIKRNLIPLWRSKSNFIIEIISSFTVLVLFILMFQTFIIYDYTKYINVSRILKTNKIYIDNITSQYFDDSYFVKKEKLKIKYDKMNIQTNYENNITFTLSNFYKEFRNYTNLGNEKVAIFKHENNSHLSFFLLYQNGNNYYKNIMYSLASSAYLKNYGINAILFNEYASYDSNKNWDQNYIMSFSINGIIILIFCFISFSGFILNPIVKERQKNIKHLLYLSGANMYCYWLGFFVVDMIKYFIAIIISFSLLLPYNFNYFIHLLPLFIVFSFVISIFLYFFSCFVDKEEQAQKSYYIIIFCILVITPFVIISFIGSLLINDNIRQFFAKLMEHFFMPYFITFTEFTPITSLIMAIIRVSVSFFIYENSTKDIEYMPRPKTLIITHCIYFIVQFIVWGLLLHLFELGYIKQLWLSIEKYFCLNKEYEFSSEVPVNDGYIIQNENRDINNNYNNTPVMNNINNTNSINNSIINDTNSDDILNEPLLNTNSINNNNQFNNRFVNNEIQKVNNNLNLSTRISGLTKTFFFCCKKNVRAVNNLYLGLESNEKFGLLGFNGSGKTTTLKCITNELLYESGEISLFGFNTKLSFSNLRKMIGYCPQENPLFEYLTVRELLTFYKSLKQSKVSVEDVCTKYGIERYIDKYCVNLSGGNKRKLTFAIALMNYPKILLLDEPSTGVDPESRRVMWKNINELSSTGNEYNMILSTHSMEEAEILCDTVSWLKSGNFICIGNPEKLKILYSAGYKLHIKFKDDKINQLIENNNNSQHQNLCDLNIEGGAFIMGLLGQISHLGFYTDTLYHLLSLISDKCDKITIKLIGKDFSFDLNILVKKEKQGQLFSQILNMKTENEFLSEISINMESLENILTRL